MSTLSTLGTCSENKWLYDPNNVFIRPLSSSLNLESESLIICMVIRK